MANNRNWHAMTVEEVLTALGSSREGLQVEEAQKRLGQFGPNEFGDGADISWLRTFLAQLQNPLVYVLIVAAFISIIAGHAADAAVILAVVVLNTAIGFIQEHRAERAMAELAKFAAPKARVRRSGVEEDIPSADVVVGDIVVLDAGDRIPADSRIIEAINLETDEAALTGESEPVVKISEPVDQEAALADRTNIAYSGTTVTKGRGEVVVVATGTETAFGKIAEQVRETERQETPLQRQLAALGRSLGIVALGLALLVFAIGLFRGIELFEMFLFAVAAAVAAIPEGLPAVVTIGLAIGLKQMASRNAVIRRLPAVESLGSATVIVSDKTGTLTQNKMTVEVLRLPESTEDITYDQIPSAKGIELLLKASTLANDSELISKDGEVRASGDPTEAAIVIAAARAGMVKDELEAQCERIDEIPFESERGYMATLHRCPDGVYIFMKGAPEAVLKLATYAKINDSEVPIEQVREHLRESNADMASRALRVLGVAYKKISDDKTTIEESDLTDGLVHLGFVGMIDPPRPEAIVAVEKCRKAGIRVIMATGDNRNTARAIADQFGLVAEGTLVVTGVELANMTEEELIEKISQIDVYARVEPVQKLRVVNALKKLGEVVAVTGDGVNDAPALKTADIGVAMGITGTGVAREAGDMVLADDNFATIVAAVEEGRIVFERIRKVVTYLVATNAGEILTVAVAIAVGLPLPLTAVALLWVNLVTDSAPSLALATDPPATDVLSRPPRSPREPVLNREAIIRLAIIAPVMAAVTLGSFFIGLDENLTKAHTMAFMALSISQLYNAVNVRTFTRSIFTISPFTNKWLAAALIFALALQALPVYVPAFQGAFDTVALGVRDWLIIFGLGSAVLWAEEIRKMFRRRMK